MSTIFLSHSSKDEAVALEMRDQLAKSGYDSLFLDVDRKDGIAPGENWQKEIYHHLKLCRVLILLCSEHSMQSRWCFAEAIHAKSEGKLVIPVKISPCTIHPELTDKQILDFTSDTAGGYQALCAELKKRLLDPKDEFRWEPNRPPYPGLTSYEADDAAFFFGRSGEIDDFLEDFYKWRQRRSQAVVVIGPSGCGKSSFVRAGILPRLKKDPAAWFVLPAFRPGGDPLTELARSLSEASGKPANEWKAIRKILSCAEQEQSLDRAASNLCDLLKDLTMSAGSREATTVLFIDQLEEILTKEALEKSVVFLNLIRLAFEKNRDIAVVATMRSDSLEAFQKHTDFPIRTVDLRRFTREQLRVVIEKPAERVGLAIESTLVDCLLNDMPTADELPWLALTLRALYNLCPDQRNARFTLEMYKTNLGGVEGVVAREVERTMGAKTLPIHDEMALRDALLKMVDLNDQDQFIRKAVPYEEFPEKVSSYLKKLVDARFLVSRTQDGEHKLEVAHEALFRVWPQLAKWLGAHKDFLLWHRHLRLHIKEYELAGHPRYKLLRRADLERANEFLRSKKDFLQPSERAFIQKSVRAQFWRRTSAGLGAAAVVGIGCLLLQARQASLFAEALGYVGNKGGKVAYDLKKQATVDLPSSVSPTEATKFLKRIHGATLLNITPDPEKTPHLEGLPTILDLFQSATLSLRHLTDVQRVPQLERLLQLESLDLSGSGVTNLDGLEYLIHLRSLNVQSTPVEETLFLGRLTNLTDLNVSYTHVKYLRGFENLTSLKTMTAKKSSLATLTSVRRLPSLEILNLAYTVTLTNLPTLTNFPALRSLDLEECANLTELPTLENLSALTNLDVSATRIIRLPGITSLTNLVSLTLPLGFPEAELQKITNALSKLKLRRTGE